MMSRIKQQLIDISHQLDVLRTDLAQSREQFDVLDEMAEEASIRAIVSESPVNDNDAHGMLAAKERLSTVISDMENEITLLKTKQDELLEKLYEESSSVDEIG